MHLDEHPFSFLKMLNFTIVTTIIRKYYNQPVSSDHRRTWLQKENQKRELQKDDLQNPDQNLRENQSQNQNPSQNLEERKNPLADIQ